MTYTRTGVVDTATGPATRMPLAPSLLYGWNALVRIESGMQGEDPGGICWILLIWEAELRCSVVAVMRHGSVANGRRGGTGPALPFRPSIEREYTENESHLSLSRLQHCLYFVFPLSKTTQRSLTVETQYKGSAVNERERVYSIAFLLRFHCLSS